MTVRLITDDHGNRREHRRCCTCRRWLEQTTVNFSPARRDPRTRAVTRWMSVCRTCNNAYRRRKWAELDRERKIAISRDRWDKIRADPEQLMRRIVADRERSRRRRSERPDAQREADRRYWQRVKSNPEKHADFLAKRRIWRRGKAMQAGHTPRKASTALGAYHVAVGSHNGDPHLDPRPLREWLEAVLAAESQADGFEFHRFCQMIGWQDRQLRAIRNGEFATVSLHVADRLLTGYGRPVVIRSKDLERRLIQWAQGLPGNGARLLAYMDRAEAVAHLADVAVLRVDDLYPELDT